MNKHYQSFKDFLAKDNLKYYPTENNMFKNISENAILLNSYLISQDISKYSHLTDSQYHNKLSKLLENPSQAITLEDKITGIEDEESVVYIQNLSPDRFQLTSYQTLNKLEHGVDSLLYSGELTIAGGFNEQGRLPMIATPKFYGVMNSNQFIKLGNENKDIMAHNMVNASIAFLEQLSLINSQKTENKIIRLN